MNRAELLDRIGGGLIVSCQAGTGHALRDTATIARLARAAADGGAVAVRCGGVGGLDDVAAVRAAVDVPMIGLTKQGRDPVFITPTVDAARAVARCGADVVALDGTVRPRPDGAPLAASIDAVHELGALVMADVATVQDGLRAAAAGADLLATTLSGYTAETAGLTGADLALVTALCNGAPDLPVVAEGRYHSPDVAAAAIRAGATAVVVGTAITDPTWITRSFAHAVTQAGPGPTHPIDLRGQP
ncbi:putative N-acetylmannosamine-6-phosphate 2-epimerase [Pseudonocardia sp. KRD291]|uniref:putative N-acetylmannosamine-6-phosphate 2-epimerase n=1 Tax=Pseudonocardia sp. KRD291 TaxID=2792007 RepID=UPI001C49D93E|nr:putative N-acetylmannosamine-6-phosphate 2-epimerase [Pseudonocardia sp. KRD291]MBW0101077.1 putative N-acetylmannosamine-6-phosphate 2-epimerase [Pseudonocardia sp. KRD291]